MTFFWCGRAPKQGTATVNFRFKCAEKEGTSTLYIKKLQHHHFSVLLFYSACTPYEIPLLVAVARALSCVRQFQAATRQLVVACQVEKTTGF